MSLPSFEASLQRCAADVAFFENDHLEAKTLDAEATAERLWSLIDKCGSLRPACGWSLAQRHSITSCPIWSYRWTGSSRVRSSAGIRTTGS